MLDLIHIQVETGRSEAITFCAMRTVAVGRTWLCTDKEGLTKP
jgi:hypothetical protein